ncbi:c-type cytochrome [Shimia sp.]|jgi:cytochrome c|uniref:c-type cytochrome n=1 Tax=unclassified Shimia TaxID=2630038 RepID=UPI0025D3F1E7|nr:cytochrome C [Shimia sp.]MCH2065906.1 cytochrome C [Shimia sp.]
MKKLFVASSLLIALGTVAHAEGDVEAGEKGFKKCKACHSVVNPDGDVLYKGGKTGPNLYGIVGRGVAAEDFKYGAGLLEAKEAGVVWTEEMLVAYVTDPKAWLKDNGYATKSKMSFKLKKGGEDVFAYLASLSPAMETEEKSE